MLEDKTNGMEVSTKSSDSPTTTSSYEPDPIRVHFNEIGVLYPGNVYPINQAFDRINPSNKQGETNK